MRKRPVVITVSGLPGSGMSTLAESLAEKLAVPLFSVDPIESAILRSGMERSFETGLAAYLVAEDLAGEQLIHGLSVIVVQMTCIGCGANGAIGELMTYMHGMGTILRCPSCDTALIRVAQVKGRYCLDMQGILLVAGQA